jgi:hypothetical protein
MPGSDDGHPLGESFRNDTPNMYVLESAPVTDIETIVQQLRAERDQLDRAIAALESMADITAPRRRRSSARIRRRTMSLAARRRIAAAQRSRWKKFRASERSVGRKAGSRKGGGRRQISAEGLARIRAAQRKRWAKARAEKK